MLTTNKIPLNAINFFLPIQSASIPANNVRDDTAEQNRRNDERKLSGFSPEVASR